MRSGRIGTEGDASLPARPAAVKPRTPHVSRTSTALFSYGYGYGYGERTCGRWSRARWRRGSPHESWVLAQILGRGPRHAGNVGALVPSVSRSHSSTPEMCTVAHAWATSG